MTDLRPTLDEDPYFDTFNNLWSVSHNNDGTEKSVTTATNLPVTTITSSANPTQYTALTTDRVILCDATTARTEITLPTAIGNTGQVYTIKKIDSTTHNVFVCPSPTTQTLDGVAGIVTQSRTTFWQGTSQWDSITIVSDGANWQKVRDRKDNKSIAWVDGTNGNDSYDGFSPEQAKKTIGAASWIAPTIYVANGTYTETVNMGNAVFYRRLLSAGDNVIVKAPNDSASAITANGFYSEIGNITFTGSGNTTYTGKVFDAAGSNNSYYHDIQIYGWNGAGSDTSAGVRAVVMSGTQGGTGLSMDNGEQNNFERFTVNNAHIGLFVGSTVTCAKNRFQDFGVNQCYQSFVEDSAPGGALGGNFYEKWKGQTCYAMAYSAGRVTSDGTNPADGDTITINGHAYRFKNTMALAQDIKIGATYDVTLGNVLKAVNQTGVAGTNYFAGTTTPSGTITAGNLGPAGDWHLDAVDTTLRLVDFRSEGTIGAAGNSITYSVSSSHLTAAGATFAGGDYAMQMWSYPNYYNDIDLCEQIGGGTRNVWAIGTSQSTYRTCYGSPQTSVIVVSGANDNLLDRFTAYGSLEIATGALRNVVRSGTQTAPLINGDKTRMVDLPPIGNNSTLPYTKGASNPKGVRHNYGTPPPSASGRYYATPRAPMTAVTLTSNRTYLVPVFLPNWIVKFSDIAVHVSTNVNFPLNGGIYQVGMDNLPTGTPDYLASNDVSANTTGDKSFGAQVSPFYQDELVWLAVGCRGGAPAVNGTATASEQTWLIGDATLATATAGSLQGYYVDGGMSSSAPFLAVISDPTTLVACGNVPIIYYKYA